MKCRCEGGLYAMTFFIIKNKALCRGGEMSWPGALELEGPLKNASEMGFKCSGT